MKLIFIGLADGLTDRFAPDAEEAIACGQVFSGGARHHELVSHLLPPGATWIDVTVPLEPVFQQYLQHPEVVVFASGDPLFFGLAATVSRRLPDAEIVVFPAPNSLQTLAHRICMPYHDMQMISLTGRDWAEFDRALILGAPKIGILTDGVRTPAAIARRILDFGFSDYSMVVGERLGNPELERIRELTLSQSADCTFDTPNCVIVHGQPRRAVFGIPDSQFDLLEGRERMITKMAVRLADLAALDLANALVFWDIGFCTGSVSIEARLRFPHLKIHAFEIRPECKSLIISNSCRHGAPGIEVHIGDFLDFSITTIPAPDAVFIGGHGGRLEQIFERVVTVLKLGGSIVINSVSSDSALRFAAVTEALGMTLAPSMHIAVDDHNPIEILKATK